MRHGIRPRPSLRPQRFAEHVGCGENVPAAPIDIVNRWGKQIFALPARGFDTLEFHDEKAGQAADMGLLSWLTGSVGHFYCFSCDLVQSASTC